MLTPVTCNTTLGCLQGLVHARITFKNEASGEYTFYEVKLTCTAPAPMGRLTLECPVRNQTSATVSITNPLTVPVTLKPTVNCKQVGAEQLGALQPTLRAHARIATT